MIYHILKDNNIPCAIGGNFGIPVFDLPILDKNGYYIFEMSSYRIELSLSIDFDIAVLLNITPDVKIANLSDWLNAGGISEANITVVSYAAES